MGRNWREAEDVIANRLALRLEAIAVERFVPVKTGELRQSINVEKVGTGHYRVGTNKVYARAVHDGRRAIKIRPRRRKALAWRGAEHPAGAVNQPARKADPFFRHAVEALWANRPQEINRITHDLPGAVVEEIWSRLRKEGVSIKKR